LLLLGLLCGAPAPLHARKVRQHNHRGQHVTTFNSKVAGTKYRSLLSTSGIRFTAIDLEINTANPKVMR